MNKAFTSVMVTVAIIVAAPFITHAIASFFVGDNGYIGIGTSNPLAPLDVAGAIYSRVATTSSSIDWSKANVQIINLTNSPTLTFNNAQAGGEYKLILNQDSTGGRTVTWPSNVKWVGGSAPTLSSSGDTTDVITLVYDGIRYLGSAVIGFNSSSLLNSIVSYWKLDGNSTDSVSAYNGTDSNVSYSGSYGKINSGASFNGSNSKISIGNASGLQLTGPVTIAFWLKLGSTASSNTFGLVTKTDDGSQRAYAIWYSNPGSAEGITFSASADGSGSNVYNWNGRNSSASPGDTNWHHYVFVFDPNGGSPTLKVYKDGTDVTSVSGTTSGGGWSGSSIYNSTSNVVIGDKTNGSWPFDGDMDEVGIWSRALTSAEVTALYNSGSGRQYPF